MTMVQVLTASYIIGLYLFDVTLRGVTCINVELCYTRAKQQWDYVTGVISARERSSAFLPDCV